LVTKSCVGFAISPGTSDASTLRSSNGQIGSPVDAIEHVQPALLGRLHDDLAHPAVDRHVAQDAGARQVPVPDAVLDELVVPLALARSSRRGATRLSPKRPAPGRWPP
jgi:hypothetical protein